MKTRLKNYAEINYPIDYEMDALTTMRNLQRKCQTGQINAIKEGKLWFVINDGSFAETRSTFNPLIA